MRPSLAWLALTAALAAISGVVPSFAADAIENSIGMRLVLIPAGRYLAGSPAGAAHADDDERPRHLVEIRRPFYLGAYEVTQAEFERVMGTNPSWYRPGGPGADQVRGQDTRRFPVDMVSFDDMLEFCRRLSALSAERSAGREYRLPTEAEWEYACRAGSATAFHCGPALSPAQANIAADNQPLAALPAATEHGPVPVGSFPPNAFGLYDMHGNVWEGCSDRYAFDYYAHAPAADPQGPAAGTGRVVRGGDWRFPAAFARSANRDFTRASRRDLGNGFRVAMTKAE
jgi:formylglycine-generating enzyme required for sulfatase activity